MTYRFDLQAITRPNIWALKPYRCARDDFSSGILLDANENSLGSSVNPAFAAVAEEQSLNRYPDPLHGTVKERLVKLRQVPDPDHIFLGVGSDEVIDILVRIFCIPGRDKILITPPTYGMYSVTAQVNDVQVVKVPLELTGPRQFQLNTAAILAATRADPTIKLVFACSPGNPTGTWLDTRDIEQLLDSEAYRGIVVVDEAYIDFVEQTKGGSVASWVARYPNLVVMQTMSKSFGLAGIRLGMAFADRAIIALMNKTKAPYNVSTLAATVALAALDDAGLRKMSQDAAILRDQRRMLTEALPRISGISEIIGGNDANFVLCRVVAKDGSGRPDSDRAQRVYERMAQECGLVVRFRGTEVGCEGCLRITVGNAQENQELLKQLELNLNLL